jgi:ribosomal protein S30
MRWHGHFTNTSKYKISTKIFKHENKKEIPRLRLRSCCKQHVRKVVTQKKGQGKKMLENRQTRRGHNTGVGNFNENGINGK